MNITICITEPQKTFSKNRENLADIGKCMIHCDKITVLCVITEYQRSCYADWNYS